MLKWVWVSWLRTGSVFEGWSEMQVVGAEDGLLGGA